MSTIDPAVQRHHDLLAKQGNRRTLAMGVAGLAAVTLACLALGVGASLMVDEMRHGVIDSIFDERTSMMERHLWLMPVCMTGGITLTLAGTGVYQWAVRRYRGGERAWFLAGPLGSVAFAIGFIVMVPAWLAPTKVGVRVDPVFEHDRDWGWGSWLLYWSNLWIPALLIAVSALFVWAAVRSSRTHLLMTQERDRLLSFGRRVPGAIHDVRVHHSSDENGSRRVVGSTVTVRYVDDAQVTRFVQRTTRGSETADHSSSVEVIYDPLRPDAETSIFVSLLRNPVPGDWIGPTAAEFRRAR